MRGKEREIERVEEGEGERNRENGRERKRLESQKKNKPWKDRENVEIAKAR